MDDWPGSVWGFDGLALGLLWGLWAIGESEWGALMGRMLLSPGGAPPGETGRRAGSLVRSSAAPVICA